MPELLEVEAYRRLAEGAVGRTVTGVDAPDAWYLKAGLDAATVADALVGDRFTAAERHGKLLLLPTGRGPVLGIRFGMTGTLLVDGSGDQRLLYSSDRDQPAWFRFSVTFADGGRLAVRDPRRLGGVTLDPDRGVLGVDAAAATPARLGAALAGSSAPLKARLLDQSRVAGVGNLLADEILWRAGLSPLRPAGDLAPAEVRRLSRSLRHTLEVLGARGGSHTGDLMDHRRRGGRCPRDGAELRRDTVGGRTTWWCPAHQV